MKKITYVSVLILITTNIYAQIIPDPTLCLKTGIILNGMPPCTTGDYYLAFEDNFNGNALDLTKWNIPYQGVTNDFPFARAKVWLANTGSTPSLPYENNIQVNNGSLKLIARKETTPIEGTYINWELDPPDYQTDFFDYSSGWVNTNAKFSYGKYEARCRLPAGQGFWPAFWTYGGPGWNEIDIFEMKGEDINKYTCDVHYDYDGNGDSEHCPFDQDNVADFSQWHIFTCIYDFDKIAWLIDGNPIRVFHRYTTLGGQPVSCGDDLGVGTYLREKSYPEEDMGIVLNLSVQSGDGAPDDNTVFPNTFEIDYVRFYIKSNGAPCDGCLDHIVYENTNQLPPLTRAKNFIFGGNNVTQQNGQSVIFKAPTIVLSPGFSAGLGAHFEAIPQECSLFNYANVPIDYTAGGTITKCIDPVYKIEATGANFYSFKVYNVSAQLIRSTSGIPTSNHIELWDATNVADGYYRAKLVLLNCLDSVKYDYTISVDYGSCKTGPSSDTTNNQETTSIQYIEEIETSSLDKEFLIYPNPASDKLNVFYSANNKNNAFIIITDANGKELFREQQENNIGANRKTIDINHFPNGSYILSIVTNNEKIENKFIITR